MKKFKLFVSLVLSVFLIGCSVNSSNESDFPFKDDEEKISNDELSDSEILQVIEDGVEWFKIAQEENGHFKYEYDPFKDIYSDDDNMVRQAGALYIISELDFYDYDDRFELKDNVLNALYYFWSESAEGSYNGYDFLCLKKNRYKCSLGGTSLALIGALNFVQKNPSYTYEFEPLINGYRDYILAMRISDAGFMNDFYFDREQNFKESPFANGEAWFALVRYHLFNNKNNEVAFQLNSVWNHFRDYYLENKDNNFYLWGMLALKDLYRLDTREEYFEYVREYTDWRINLFAKRRDSQRNYGAYNEGVAAAVFVLQDNLEGQELEEYMGELDFWLTKHRNFQVSQDKYKVKHEGEEGYSSKRIKNMDLAFGGFLTAYNEPLQRIDFTQHCLSAYLQTLIDIREKDL